MARGPNILSPTPLAEQPGSLFFNAPTDFSPIATQTGPLGLPQAVKLPYSPKPKEDGSLPPIEKRTSEEEARLRQTQKKDIEAFEVGSGKNEIPWKPLTDEEFDARHGTSTKLAPTAKHSTPLSVDSFPDNHPETDPDEDIRRLAEYVKEIEANELVEKPDESKKSHLEKTKLEASGGKKSNILPGKKGSESAKQGLNYEFFNEKWEVYDSKDEEGTYQHDVRVFGGHAKATAGAGRVVKDGATSYGAHGELSGGGSLLSAKGIRDSNGMVPSKTTGEVTALKAEGKVAGEALVNFEEGTATLNGELGGELVLIEAKIDQEFKVIPARWADSACDHTALDRWKHSKQFCEAVESDRYDYGISLGAGATAQAGAGLKGKSKNEFKNGRFTTENELGAALFVGGKLRVNAGAGHFPR